MQLKKGLGLPYGKTVTVLQQAFGLQVSRGGLCQALARVASKAEPTYNALVEGSPQCECNPGRNRLESRWRALVDVGLQHFAGYRL